MTGLPPNIQIAAQQRAIPQGIEAELMRLRRLIISRRIAEKALSAATTAAQAKPHLQAKKNAENALRQIADHLIVRGHP